MTQAQSVVGVQEARRFAGAGPEWPERSRPPSGSERAEACWLLGLPAVKLVLDRDVAPAGPIHLSQLPSCDPALDHPLLSRLLAVEGVLAALARGPELIVSARVADAAWPELVERLERCVTEHFDVDEGAIRAKVQAVLDQEINPGVASHGGKITLVDVQGSAIVIHMGGGCQGCGMAAVTLRQGVERTLRERVPEVTEIRDSTDHDAGANPYY